MAISNRLYKVVDNTDGDKTWDPGHVLGGILEVANNSSSLTTKTFPYYSSLISTDRVSAGDTVQLIIWNKGSQNLNLAPNSSSSDFIVGDTVVLAGGIKLIQLVVGYTSGVMCIFCV